MLERRTLAKTRLEVTAIALGALEIGRDWGVGTDTERPDEAGAKAVLEQTLALGINLIDTASAYHRSEERIGKFISDRRKNYVLATKCGEHNREPNTYYDFSYGAIKDSVERSLELLQTDVIDLLQIHFSSEGHKILDDGGCVRAMKEAQEAGKVRFLGASIHGEVLARCIESGDFDVIQAGYSLLHQGDGAQLRKAHERGIGVLIRSGFAGGWLTSRALAVAPEKRPPAVNALLELCEQDTHKLTTLALHFLLNEPSVGAVLVGTKQPQHLREAVAMAQTEPDQELLREAQRIVESHQSQV